MPEPASKPLDEAVIDLSLVEQMLRMSYEERISAHESARELVNDLLEAGREYRANESETTSRATPTARD